MQTTRSCGIATVVLHLRARSMHRHIFPMFSAARECPSIRYYISHTESSNAISLWSQQIKYCSQKYLTIADEGARTSKFGEVMNIHLQPVSDSITGTILGNFRHVEQTHAICAHYKIVSVRGAVWGNTLAQSKILFKKPDWHLHTKGFSLWVRYCCKWNTFYGMDTFWVRETKTYNDPIHSRVYNMFCKSW